ncbi:WD40 repeat-like protein [Suillus weaverae]|nr:WD40 repeat-like protein [Suillus weaverae]
MLHAKAEPSTSANQREANRGLLSDSSGPVTPLKREKNPPRYGAQHRQDALWEGGNETLPPMWIESKVAGQPRYRDSALFMSSSHRPLPGVRLDHSWDLIPGCEWHISPLGRSYFVNNNTRTTSWKKPTPERPAGSLMPECIIKCGSLWYNASLACLGASGNIMRIFDDGSIHQWTRAGQPVGKPFGSDMRDVFPIVVSPDGLMVAGECGDGRVRLWNIKEGRLVGHPWEGHNDGVTCLDWSPNGAEVAGGSKDGTIRRWNPVTGRQIAPPIKRGDKYLWTIKYSPQSDKFASGGGDKMVRVWSKDGELLIEIDELLVMSLCWSKDGAYIFSGSFDTTIRKWQSIDGEELVVVQGHTQVVRSLCLSPDGSHLISASLDYSVRIWDLETNQQVGDPLWHDDQVLAVAVSSDGQYFTSAICGLDAKIYVWSLEAALKRASGVASDTEPNAKPNAKPKARGVAILTRSCRACRGRDAAVTRM